MKRFLLLLCLAGLAVACGPREQVVTVPDGIEDNLYRFGVNTSPYEYFHVAETPVPAGYKPFYISHYGRHGARSDWDGGYGRVLAAYEKAHEAGALSEEGERAYSQIKTICDLHNEMNGRLTPRGAREHRQIAHRLYCKYKDVFRSGSRHVRAVSSTSPRCLVSMAAFTGELLSLDPGLDVSWDTGEQFMKYLSSGDPAEVTKEAYRIIGEFISSYKPDTMYFAQRVFSDVDAGRAAVGGSIEDLMSGTIGFAAISGSFDQDQTLIDLFNVEDLRQYERLISLNLFLRQCNSAEFGDRRMAVPEVDALVEDFIGKADAAIADGNCVADLRFGHDWHLLAFCSRIGVKGIGERLTNEEAFNWPGWQYSPFAGNFQMVFYRNRAGNVLVKCFINERETTLLGLPDGPYYDWADVKQAWRRICE